LTEGFDTLNLKEATALAIKAIWPTIAMML